VARPFSGRESSLVIVIEDHGPHLIVRLRGELDLTEADRLRELMTGLIAREPRVLVADLSGLTFLDCAGLSVLVHAHQRQDAEGRRLLIYGAPPLVRRVLTLTGMDIYLHLAPGYTKDG
jgi:stage II sporulation protein AA (anti-sigma F factor antagonist)